MLSDEELIDGLQSALATLQPRSDLIACVRERAAADQPRDLPSRPTRRPRSLPAFSAVVAIACVVVALAIGGGALVLLSGHHPSGLRRPLHRSRRRRTRRAARGAAAHSPSALARRGAAERAHAYRRRATRPRPRDHTARRSTGRAEGRCGTAVMSSGAGRESVCSPPQHSRPACAPTAYQTSQTRSPEAEISSKYLPEPILPRPRSGRPGRNARSFCPTAPAPAPGPRPPHRHWRNCSGSRCVCASTASPSSPTPGRPSRPTRPASRRSAISTGRSCSSRPRSTCSPRHTGRL